MIEDLRLHGDQIGRFGSVTLDPSDGPHGRLTVHDVRVFGQAEMAFMLEQECASDAAKPARTYRLREADGDVVATGLVADVPIDAALASGARHILLRAGRERILVDLNGLPGRKATVSYAASGERLELPDLRGKVAAVRRVAQVELTFAAGTRIASAKGRRPIEDLRAGSLVWTLDHGLRAVRDVRRERIRFGAANGHLRPVCISASALGQGCPSSALRLAPDQRVSVTGWRAELFFGRSQAMMPANALLSLPGIARDDEVSDVTYCTLVFDDAAVIEVGGILAEGTSVGVQPAAHRLAHRSGAVAGNHWRDDEEPRVINWVSDFDE
ncbi:Hint domain-containing protein [Oceaniglobus indicus]|uniref:Hint domain-containing protein n=1 Tax=Oceaniglobus indicus TaxID=2047749 RepID=UPI000C18B96E|nr:Hint domain-containing protein [Oceaniglobus indicus]